MLPQVASGFSTTFRSGISHVARSTTLGKGREPKAKVLSNFPHVLHIPLHSPTHSQVPYTHDRRRAYARLSRTACNTRTKRASTRTQNQKSWRYPSRDRPPPHRHLDPSPFPHYHTPFPPETRPFQLHAPEPSKRGRRCQHGARLGSVGDATARAVRYTRRHQAPAVGGAPRCSPSTPWSCCHSAA